MMSGQVLCQSYLAGVMLGLGGVLFIQAVREFTDFEAGSLTFVFA